MTDQSNTARRQAGPALDPDERPSASGKRWAILLGFAAVEPRELRRGVEELAFVLRN